MYRALFLVSCVVLAVQASNVLEFTDSNFKDKIKDHSVALVEFYAPWCGHCKKLAPEYEKAADRLASNDPPVALVKVDCTAETAVCGEFGVSGYPTLKIFKNGEFNKEYQGPREADGIVKTLMKEAGPASKELKSNADFEAFISRPGGSVVGFFSDADSKAATTFQKVADSYDELRFAHTYSSDVMDKQNYKDNIVLFRSKEMASKFEDSAVKYTGDATQSHKIREFLDEEKFGLCGYRTGGNADKFKRPTFAIFYNVDFEKDPKGTNYWRNRVMKVAKKVRDEGQKAYFGVSSSREQAGELGECGLKTDSDKPVVCAYSELMQKFQMQEEFSVESFEKFVRDVLDLKVEPYLKSEPIPANNDEPVKVVVAKNFDEIVNNDDKDVLVEFYAPWCGHCKSLAPKFDELAETLKDEPEITIAKMDATANDVPSPYEVRGFPTLYFSPKGSKLSPKKYEGGREVDDFLKYLAKESTNELVGFDRNGKKKGGKKKTEF